MGKVKRMQIVSALYVWGLPMCTYLITHIEVSVEQIIRLILFMSLEYTIVKLIENRRLCIWRGCAYVRVHFMYSIYYGSFFSFFFFFGNFRPRLRIMKVKEMEEVLTTFWKKEIIFENFEFLTLRLVVRFLYG